MESMHGVEMVDNFEWARRWIMLYWGNAPPVVKDLQVVIEETHIEFQKESFDS